MRSGREPAPRAMLLAFGECSLNFEFLIWIRDPSMRFRTIDRINRDIYRKFNELGIKIPFPQRELHIYERSA